MSILDYFEKVNVYEKELNRIINVETIGYSDYNYLKDFNMSIIQLSRLDKIIDTHVQLKELMKKYFKYDGINDIENKAIESYTFTKEQKKAIKELIKFLSDSNNKVFGLYGYAGSGKTTIIIRLIYFLIRSKLLNKVGISAPTHKALNVMKTKFYECSDDIEKTNMDEKVYFFTIHKLLNFTPDITNDGDIDFIKNGKSLLMEKYNVIIIDECSMISKKMCELLLSEITTYNKIIFCGDLAQLPPVNERESIIFNKVANNITLEKIVRCKNKYITGLWNEIRLWINGENPEFKKYINKRNIFFYKDRQQWINKCIDNMKDKKCDIVLAWTNRSVTEYNNILRNELIAENEINNKYANGDILIINNFYKMKGELMEEKLYTSEQIIVIKAEHMIFKLHQMNNLKSKKLFNEIIEKYNVIVGKINEITKREYSCWKLIVKKFSIEKEINDNTYIVYVCDDEKLDIDKQKSLELLKHFRKKYSKAMYADMIKTLMKSWYETFVETFADINYGYAITCHKSQGSTYHNVFIDVEDIFKNENEDDSRRCLYTAITRASHEIHLLLK